MLSESYVTLKLNGRLKLRFTLNRSSISSHYCTKRQWFSLDDRSIRKKQGEDEMSEISIHRRNAKDEVRVARGLQLETSWPVWCNVPSAAARCALFLVKKCLWDRWEVILIVLIISSGISISTTFPGKVNNHYHPNLTTKRLWYYRWYFSHCRFLPWFCVVLVYLYVKPI